MIFGAILILLMVVSVALTINHFESKLKKEKSKISIKESLDLIDLPVITFTVDNTKLNFLIDTGSSESHVSKEASKHIFGTRTKVESSFIGSAGGGGLTETVNTVLEYKSLLFMARLFINECLDSAFSQVQEAHGVQLHGILGSDFLRDYKYVIDFDELTAYQK